jgi:energy-coupling factor transport system permease protein
MRLFKASSLHPATWWLLGLAFALGASLSSKHLVLLALILLSTVTIRVFREDAPWSRSIRFYLALATFVVSVRLGFRILFNSPVLGEQIAFRLPELNVAGVHLLGEVSWAALSSATLDGLRLAAIIVAIGMANSLANPKRLLKSTPGALYEIATAMTVAINLAPQLIESLQRVQRARTLRGRSKGMSALGGTVIPVLEDTIDQSLALAASMDARGFGRTGNLTKRERGFARVLSFGGLLTIVIASYLLLATSEQKVLSLVLISTGITALALNIRIASRRSLRTRFRRVRPGSKDLLIALFGLAVAVLGGVL